MEDATSDVVLVKASAMKNLLDIMECPICSEKLSPPVFQCENGHVLCSVCKTRVKRCPSCRSNTLDVRSIALEQLVECFEYPCRYRITGCNQTFQYSSKLQHEENCTFRPYRCPYSEDCNLRGNISALVRHLKEFHSCARYTVPRSVHDNRDDGIKDEMQRGVVCHYFGFWLFISLETIHFQNHDCGYLVSVASMGDHDEAGTFRCRLEVGDEDHKLVWEGKPLSIRLGRKELNETMVGLSIPGQLTNRFSKSSHSGSWHFPVKSHISKKGLLKDPKHTFIFSADIGRLGCC